MWNELKVADFSYNTLKTIDCSLEFAPFLQQLNLSHNKIFRVDAIKWLPNLKKLNLSYNSLTYVPHLHGDAARRLQTLILTNNFIEDLNGIARLDSVSELNLSNNCILDHAALTPLSTLIALQYLHLHGMYKSVEAVVDGRKLITFLFFNLFFIKEIRSHAIPNIVKSLLDIYIKTQLVLRYVYLITVCVTDL